MKRIAQGMLVVGLAMSVASAARAFTPQVPFAYPAGSGINGTVHDLGSSHNGMNYTALPADPLQRICIFCHAPHNTYKLSPANGGPGAGVGGGAQAPDAFSYLPLWNHQLTGNFAVYQMYQNGLGAPTKGPRASQAVQQGMTPGGPSLLCLSCHDGSVAVNSYGNASGPQMPYSASTGGATIDPQYQIGKDNYLGNHHPIGFDYDAVQAVDIELRSADTAQMGAAGPVRNHLFGPGNTKMECGTCHAVHNKGNTGETLLWRSDASSHLCLTCHDKGTDPGTATP